MELISTVAAAYLVILAGGPAGSGSAAIKVPMKSMEACEQHVRADAKKWTIYPAGVFEMEGAMIYKCFRTDVKK